VKTSLSEKNMWKLLNLSEWSALTVCQLVITKSK
jgi:hypothetical protein